MSNPEIQQPTLLPIEFPTPQDSPDREAKVSLVSISQILEHITDGEQLLDVGCGGGGLGVAIATKLNCKLAQADVMATRDPRRLKSGELHNLPTDCAPTFEGGKADRILVVDVLPHIKPYAKITERFEDPKERQLETWRAFLHGCTTALAEDGNIIIGGRNQPYRDLQSPVLGENMSRIEMLRELVKGDEELKDRVLFI